MSIWKAALLGLTIPAALVLPAAAQQGPQGPRLMFEEMDLDGDGALTLEEVRGARAARFADADTNGDGLLDRDEMIAAAAERVARRVDAVIERGDADGDGALSLDEMADERGARRGPGLERMFERFDRDGDGTVTEAEFDEAVADFRGGRFDGRGHGPGFGRHRG